jgi:hypothetical protein
MGHTEAVSAWQPSISEAPSGRFSLGEAANQKSPHGSCQHEATPAYLEVVKGSLGKRIIKLLHGHKKGVG